MIVVDTNVMVHFLTGIGPGEEEALREGLSTHDTESVALARRLSVPLLTADRALQTMVQTGFTSRTLWRRGQGKEILALLWPVANVSFHESPRCVEPEYWHDPVLPLGLRGDCGFAGLAATQNRWQGDSVRPEGGLSREHLV